MSTQSYTPVIGLEIHLELNTQSKMFCRCPAHHFAIAANTHTCPVCLGMPGALPVPNKKAVEYTIQLASALNCTIARHSHFDRKHYFYPDIPKGYQISQYDEPIGQHGYIELINPKETVESVRSFRIRRVHLEEDTGKLLHGDTQTSIDFNRSSVPLVEIVTEADFRSADEVKLFLDELHAIIRTTGVSEANMEQGSMRVEPNISLSIHREVLDDTPLPNYKVEVKNINSFNFARLAIEFELKRQAKILDTGETPRQETRGWNAEKGETVFQRTKENAADYRYFPDPDIPPMQFDDAYITSIAARNPELPLAKLQKLCAQGIKIADAYILSREHAEYEKFAELLKIAPDIEPQKIANLIVNKKVDFAKPATELTKEIKDMLAPKETDTNLLTNVITEVLARETKSVTDYKAGKMNAIMFLLGQVMKGMGGKADAAVVKEALQKYLS